MKKYCRVSVGTIWRNPNKPRKIDEYGVHYPSEMQRWLLEMNLEDKMAFSKNNMVDTQVLYGEPVEVLEEKGSWSYIVCLNQPSKTHELGYAGYIPTIQLGAMKDLDSSQKIRINVPKTTLYNLDLTKRHILSFNTILPVIQLEETYIKVDTPEGECLIASEDVELSNEKGEFETGDMEGVIHQAKKFIDLPYFWGGMSSYGYDCSGFVFHMFKSQNFHIPRDADEQYESLKAIPINYDNLQKGDLLFFSKPEEEGFLSHVGIYIGNKMMIHAPHTPNSIEIIKLENSYYEEILAKAARLF